VTADATLRALHALAGDITAPDRHRALAADAADIVTAAYHTASCWGGKTNAEVRADVLMPSTVRGRGAVGRNTLIDALDELARRCAS